MYVYIYIYIYRERERERDRERESVIINKFRNNARGSVVTHGGRLPAGQLADPPLVTDVKQQMLKKEM